MKNVKMITFFLAIPMLLMCNGCFLDSGKNQFIDDFDLQLKGEVLSITENDYNHYLICLKVLESNMKEYFPIFEPFNKDGNKKSTWDKRFFVKVQDSLALIILYNGDTSQKILHNKIKNKSIIEINMDGEKAYDIYDPETSKLVGGRKITTSPIRNSIEISCLRSK